MVDLPRVCHVRYLSVRCEIPGDWPAKNDLGAFHRSRERISTAVLVERQLCLTPASVI